MTRLRVAFAGPHVTLQDAGRPGLMRFGVPASGPMDRKAYAIAMGAVGAEGAGIEVSLGGLALDCIQGAVTLAVAGGGFILDHAGRCFGSWQMLTLRAGERLTVRRGPWGSWTCLAFAGRLVAETWLNSAATHAPSGLGGGRLATGQEIEIAEARILDRDGPIPCPVWARPRSLLHAVAGPQERFFAPGTLDTFFSAPFRLSDAYDRMGVRLDGPPLPPEGALSIPSEAILRGSVQVNGQGVASLLLADHQTTGGYPKIATVIADDLDGFAQLRPHDRVRFRRVTAEEAVALARTHAALTAPILSRGLSA